MRRALTGALALSLAVAAGSALQRGMTGERPSPALAAAGAGLRSFRGLLADLLYMRADQYYHLAQYNGEEWTTESDYLPLISLVVELRPDFEAAYSEGAYQLVVNLGLADEGFRLLEHGIRECPGSMRLRWENCVIRWQACFGTLEERRAAGEDFLASMRRSQPFSEPTEWERNALLIQSLLFREDSIRMHSLRLASLYERRRQLLCSQMRVWGAI